MNVRMNVDTAKLSAASPAIAERSTTTVARAAAEAVSTPKPPPTIETVRKAAAQIDSYLRSIGRTLDIRVDSDTGRTVVTVRNAETGETIRQIPSEEALKLARALSHGAGASGLPVMLDELA